MFRMIGLTWVIVGSLLAVAWSNAEVVAADVREQLRSFFEIHCCECHDSQTKQGGLDLSGTVADFGNAATFARWVRVHDRVQAGEMPPDASKLPAAERAAFVARLAKELHAADLAGIQKLGRGPLRRLNRNEFQQNLRDLLQLPHLDIRDMLPADREAHHFDKVSETLDMSRVQLAAYLDATEAALRQALVTTHQPPATYRYRATGKRLSQIKSSTGGRESLFFIRDSAGIDLDEKRNAPDKASDNDESIELGLFRSPGWPYAIYPKGLAVPVAGEYRVRFAARAVLQKDGFRVLPGNQAVPLTFRSRRPTNHDIAEDVRATGGILDIQPSGGEYETTVLLNAGQTIEYGLLGLPVPQVDAEGKTGHYRYPPFPAGGQPGIAFRWLELEGPLPPASWPPPSHRVLFDDIGPDLRSSQPDADAKRLLRRFLKLVAREPVSDEAAAGFEKLVANRLQRGASFADALLAGYQAVLCSDLFLYLREPQRATDHFAIAQRLSHFLTNSRPDEPLLQLAAQQRLREPTVLRRETERLISSDGGERFFAHFTDSWLGLRDVRRDDPDIRLYPEYRLDEFLVESLERETRTFFAAMVRDNLPATALVTANFTFANSRLARHYGLPPISGAALRRVSLPADSPYGGLLTQGAILKISANGTATSPVVRGAWVTDRIVGQPPPPPPPGVPAVEPDIRGAKTIREQLAAHTKSQVCASCHAKFDPVGLALENFDVLGAWRTRYRGLEAGDRVSGIDRSGHDFSYTLAAPVDASGQLLDGQTFRNVHDLKALLAKNPRQLARNLLHQFTTYATGTPARFADRAELETMLDACAADGYRVRDLLVALIQSPVFLGRPSP